MDQDSLVSSIVPWYPSKAGEVIERIRHATFPDSPNLVIFRPHLVSDATAGRMVPAAAERLIRWDTRPPNEVFTFGFPPWVHPTEDALPDALAYNLRSYVDHDTRSIFVGAARYYRQEERTVRWQPQIGPENTVNFQYEILVFGGIDVNLTLGMDHQYASQSEVAFPGGIHSEFVRSAKEYFGTRIVRYWENPRFNNMINPVNHIPPLNSLPRITRRANVPVVPYTQRDGFPEPSPRHAPSRNEAHRRRGEDEKDLMRTDGQANPDEDLGEYSTLRTTRACFLSPTDEKRAYFLFDNRYASINVDYGTADTIATGPYPLAGRWQSLVQAGFGTVDAILPNPKNKSQLYFFSGKKYALIRVNPGKFDDYIVTGPRSIVEDWPDLREAGFTTVDAVLPHPNNKGDAFFFRGGDYVWIKIKPGTNDNTIVVGPRPIVDGWASLKKAGFQTIDAALPNPYYPNEVYFFSGEKYVRVNFRPDGIDTIVHGPFLVEQRWASLHNAGFW